MPSSARRKDGPDPDVRKPLHRTGPFEGRAAVPPKGAQVARGDPHASPLRLAPHVGDVPAGSLVGPDAAGDGRDRIDLEEALFAEADEETAAGAGHHDRRGPNRKALRLEARQRSSRKELREAPRRPGPEDAVGHLEQVHDLRPREVAHRRHRFERGADGGGDEEPAGRGGIEPPVAKREESVHPGGRSGRERERLPGPVREDRGPVRRADEELVRRPEGEGLDGRAREPRRRIGALEAASVVPAEPPGERPDPEEALAVLAERRHLELRQAVPREV